MNSVDLLVMFRTTGHQMIIAPLEFEGARAFAVLHEYGRKGTGEVVSKERMELDAGYLEKMDRAHGAHLLYKRDIRLPDPKMN